MIEAIDHIVTAEDTDRSKWIRRAMREALQRRGISA
jgi:metal-responsive CopG/Arc/MetJ family transcriptional regulator